MKQEKQDRLKAKVLSFVEWWEPLLDLPGVAVDHRFHDKFADPSNPDSTCAETVSEAPYRFASIHWYLSSIARLDDEDIERVVVHEYVHILNSAVESKVKEKDAEWREVSAENVARALISTAQIAKQRETATSVEAAFDAACRELKTSRGEIDAVVAEMNRKV